MILVLTRWPVQSAHRALACENYVYREVHPQSLSLEKIRYEMAPLASS